MHGLVSKLSVFVCAAEGASLGADVAFPAGGSVVPFGKLCVYVVLVPNEYPSEVLTFSDPLPS
ncbi:hypothetical protein, partial [Mycobacterium tuberculosis]